MSGIAGNNIVSAYIIITETQLKMARFVHGLGGIVAVPFFFELNN
jgi:hypothetical protein